MTRHHLRRMEINEPTNSGTKPRDEKASTGLVPWRRDGATVVA